MGRQDIGSNRFIDLVGMSARERERERKRERESLNLMRLKDKKGRERERIGKIYVDLY